MRWKYSRRQDLLDGTPVKVEQLCAANLTNHWKTTYNTVIHSCVISRLIKPIHCFESA